MRLAAADIGLLSWGANDVVNNKVRGFGTPFYRPLRGTAPARRQRTRDRGGRPDGAAEVVAGTA